MHRSPFDQYRRFLCHYTSRYAALAHILPQGLLRLAPFGLMRDPLEAKDIYVAVTPPRGPLPATYEAVHHDLNARVNLVLKRQFKLLSMTSDDEPLDADGRFPMGQGHFGRCYARPRMWEQYAEGHQGVCLLFGYDALIEAVSNALRESDWYRRGPVCYRPMSKGLRADPQVAWDDVQVGSTQDLIEVVVAERAEEALFNKFDDYASEQEYRFVVRSSDAEHLHVEFGDSLVGVVLGAEFPKAELRPLILLCARLGASLLRMEWRQGLGQIAGFYNPTIPIEHNHAAEIAPLRDTLARWHPSLDEYETFAKGSS